MRNQLKFLWFQAKCIRNKESFIFLGKARYDRNEENPKNSNIDILLKINDKLRSLIETGLLEEDISRCLTIKNYCQELEV